jgi:hypothetical protein
MSVFISNIDDFITPGQVCVNQLVLSRDNFTNSDSNYLTSTTSKKQVISIQNDDTSDSLNPHPTAIMEAN